MYANVADAKQIFLQAVESHEPDRWPDFLQEVCGTDSALRHRVEALLAAYQRPNEMLDKPGLIAAFYPPMAEQPGMDIGPYKLLEQIGEGGFGVVFLAEQSAPVRRKVALKLVKPGMDSRQVIARFGAERQALAMMDHPNIAKVHDAGATENGRPYFVMELVLGIPITEYCDQCNLTTRERLELFVTVCQGVQHAHQKGVIHRDIKPTNVLVAMQDGQPAPKIIDFGVAKAIDQRLTEHTLTTAFAQMVGTPLYMSPEQAELSPLGVDTRSDIYSLGVLLYELLSGMTPFDKDRLHSAPYDELRRIIREEEPPRPSARISTLAADLATTVAEHRRTDARRLRQTVHGELDWIVMKCLEKDRNRRYDSAGSLARDIERYRHEEPVQACPPSISYRLKKFIRRNKVAAAFVLILLASVAALTVSNIQTRRNERRAVTESAKAIATSELLLAMLNSASPDQAKGSEYTVRELLDEFSGGLGDQLKDQPESESAVRLTIGNAYRRLGLTNQAEPHLDDALKLRREVFGDNHEKVAESQVALAWNLLFQGKQEQGEALVREALKYYESHRTDPKPAIFALWTLQCTLNRKDRYNDAAAVAQQALDVAAERQWTDSPEVADVLSNFAQIRIHQARFPEAEQLALRSVELHRRWHAPQHPQTAFALEKLGVALHKQGKSAEAEPVLKEALSIFRRHYTPDNSAVVRCLANLKRVLEARGDKPALEALAKEEAEQATRLDNLDNHVRLTGLLLANIQPSDAQKEEAHRQIQRAIETYGRVAVDSPGDFRHRMDATDGCARAIQICAAVPGFHNEVDELSRLLSAELPRLVADFPDSSQSQWEIAMCYNSWGRILFAYSDQLPTAEHAFRESNEILKKLSLSVPNRPYVWIWLASTYVGLGDAQWRSGRLDDAEPPLRTAMEIYDEHAEKIAADIAADPFPGINSEIIAAYIQYAFYLAATHRDKEAADFVGKATLDAKHLTDPVELVNSLWMTALAQLELGDEAGYRSTCQALVDVSVASADDVTKWRAIWPWCLAPDALEDPTLPVKRAEEFVANNSLTPRHFGYQLLGAALYRAGRYEQAAERLQEAIVAYPSDPPLGFDSINYTQLLLAMTNWQKGQHDEARRLFAKARLAVDKELQTPSIQLHRRATLEVLRREAETLIGKSDAGEAVENESRKSNEPEHPHP